MIRKQTQILRFEFVHKCTFYLTLFHCSHHDVIDYDVTMAILHSNVTLYWLHTVMDTVDNISNNKFLSVFQILPHHCVRLPVGVSPDPQNMAGTGAEDLQGNTERCVNNFTYIFVKKNWQENH